MSSLSELYLVLAPLMTSGLVTSYTYPIDWEGGVPTTTLSITDEWARVLGTPEDEDTLTLSIEPDENGHSLVILEAARSNWDLVLGWDDVHWEELAVVRDRFFAYQQGYE